MTQQNTGKWAFRCCFFTAGGWTVTAFFPEALEFVAILTAITLMIVGWTIESLGKARVLGAKRDTERLVIEMFRTLEASRRQGT